MQKSRQRTRTTYDRLSRWYDLLTGESEGKISEAGVAMLKLQEGVKVLEIGFGTGKNLLALADKTGKPGLVVGIDLSRGMTREARARLRNSKPLSNVILTLGDAVDLPFSADYFDVVYMAFTLELFDLRDISRVLDEAWRILTKSGRLCVIALAKTESAGKVERGYVLLHRMFPHFLDCQPIFTQRLIETRFDIVQYTRNSIWGLQVDTVIAVKRTS